jgi:general L-amino acid transport system permease protein
MSRLRKAVSSPSRRFGIALLVAVAAAIAIPLFQWAVLDAKWSGSAEDCRAVVGACWASVGLRLDFLFYGFYPAEEHFRPLATILIALAAILVVIFVRSVRKRLSRIYLTILITFVASVLLLKGDGVLLANVPSRLWTGFTLTVTVAFGGIALALPLGIALAFGRNYGGTFVSATCTTVIETLRALPSVVTIFIVMVVAPYVLPPALGESMFLRIMVGFVLVMSAFYAEALRGALLSFSTGQVEAAQSLGLKGARVYGEVVLPQVIALSFPALMNITLMVFKDTVLILAFGYYELLGAANASINTQEWSGFAVEMFIFIYIVFFISCSMISYVGRVVEQGLYSRAA